MKRLIPIFLAFSSLVAQDNRLLISAFESAGAEFGVPDDVLKGIAFAETRWEHLEWSPEDTASCMGLPRSFGVMALRSDSWFGHSLEQATGLLGADPEILKKDFVQNIRGAAAYLRSLYNRLPIPEGTTRGSFESWQNAIAAYCGIPQPELAQQHALEIYERAAKGYRDFGIVLDARPVNLAPLHQSLQRAWTQAQQNPTQLNKRTGQPDYPGAQWLSAYPNHWYTTGTARDFVVIHDMEGYYLSVLSYFQMSTTEASAHYCINGLQDNASDRPAGEITQMVEEQNWAWHVRCWNRYMLGIEHEGFVSNPAWYTVEQYLASAKLTRYLCLKYGIPLDRNHIIGHNEHQNQSWQNWVDAVYKLTYPAFDRTCNDHTDPGQYWDWEFYMQMVKQDSTAPQVTSVPPADSLNVFQSFSITFNQRLKREDVEAAFSISPLVPGSFSWSTNGRTMTFTPGSPLSHATSYIVTIDSSAHNYLGIGLDVNKDGQATGEVYSFVFNTVTADTDLPSLVSTYPQNNQGGISTSVEFILKSSKPLQPNTFPGAFSIRTVDSVLVDDNPLLEYQTVGYSTEFRIRPKSPLGGNSSYRLYVSGQIQDYTGNAFPDTAITFTTGAELGFPGTVVNAVETLDEWWQPSESGSTVNAVADWSIVNDPKKEGSGSGKLTYAFTKSSGGLVREYTPMTPAVDAGGSMVGAWVYGDNSRNILEYWFYYFSVASNGDTTTNVSMKSAGQITWTGWKLLALPTSLIPPSTAPTRPHRTFAGFAVRQGPSGSISGTVYFDALTVANGITANEQVSPPVLPAVFALSQNFPNPFNPETRISYNVSVASTVRLTVYDLLGREVRVLVDEKRAAGTYDVMWDASSFPSGVYYVRMQAAGFMETKKMVLIR